MKKQYITPSIKGHKILLPKLICNSGSDANEEEMPEVKPSGGPYTNDQSKAVYNRCSFFDDEPTEENDFAHGL